MVLQWKNVDFDEGEIHISKQLNRSSSLIKTGEKKFSLVVMEQAGVEDANFHTLRNTFATKCIENGMDILMVAKTLRRSNVSTTLNIYVHSSMSRNVFN